MDGLTRRFVRRESDVPVASTGVDAAASGTAGGLPGRAETPCLVDSPCLADSPSRSPNGSRCKPCVSPELFALRWMVRAFFVAFAVLRLLDACGVRITLAGELSVLLGGLLIIAHMAATVIGTTRRNAAPDEPSDEREAWLVERRRLIAGRAAARLPAPNTLRDDHAAGGWLFACIFVGATAAAALMAAVTFPAWVRFGILGVLILELSAATIGAYFGYMTGRLTATARRAWVEATAEVSGRGSEPSI